MCFALWILVDSFNGFAVVNNIAVRPSRIFKFIVFAIVMVRLIRFEGIKIIIFFLIPYVIILFVNSYYVNADPIDTLTLLLKPLSNITFFLYGRHIAINNSEYFEKKFWKVFIFGFVMLLTNILLGLMGYGYHVYGGGDNGIGVKGFLYAQNEISGLIVYLYPLMLYYIRFHYSRIIYYIFCVLCCFMSFSIGTKVGLVVAITSCFVVTYYLGSKIEKVSMIIFGVSGVIFGVVYIYYLLTLKFDFLVRFMYFYEQNGLVDAITSGRLHFLEERFDVFYRMDFLSRLFGWGGNEDFVCEMDPFDAILQFGYIGGIINVLLFLYLIIVPRLGQQKNKYKQIMIFCNTLLVLIAVFSGHIFFSSMAGLFIALANAGLYKKIKQQC